jgi:hypothetical protein
MRGRAGVCLTFQKESRADPIGQRGPSSVSFAATFSHEGRRGSKACAYFFAAIFALTCFGQALSIGMCLLAVIVTVAQW